MTKLFFNHAEAWQVTFGIAALAMILHRRVSAGTFLLVLAITTGYWLAFVLNDYFDAPDDAQDEQKGQRNFFVTHTISPTVAGILFVGVSAGIALIFAQFGGRGWLTFAIALLVMWAYSSPPLRLKHHPGADLLIHALFVETFPYLLMLILLNVAWTKLDWVILIILILASLAAQLEQQIRDFAIDRRTGHTFVTQVGVEKSQRFLKIITGFASLFTVLHILRGTFPIFLLPIGAICVPALYHRLTRQGHQSRSEWLVMVSSLVGFLYMATLCLFSFLGQQSYYD